jgi:hypothetical protein
LRPPTGTASWPFATPNSLALDNTYIYTQTLVLDPAGAAGFAASAGLRFRAAVSAP